MLTKHNLLSVVLNQNEQDLLFTLAICVCIYCLIPLCMSLVTQVCLLLSCRLSPQPLKSVYIHYKYIHFMGGIHIDNGIFVTRWTITTQTMTTRLLDFPNQILVNKSHLQVPKQTFQFFIWTMSSKWESSMYAIQFSLSN